MLNAAEVAKHGHRGSCWVIISGQVYDVTEFLPDHPGGASIILRYGGRVWPQIIAIDFNWIEKDIDQDSRMPLRSTTQFTLRGQSKRVFHQVLSSYTAFHIMASFMSQRVLMIATREASRSD